MSRALGGQASCRGVPDERLEASDLACKVVTGVSRRCVTWGQEKVAGRGRFFAVGGGSGRQSESSREGELVLTDKATEELSSKPGAGKFAVESSRWAVASKLQVLGGAHHSSRLPAPA